MWAPPASSHRRSGLNDAILREFGRNGARLGWRVGLFTAMFTAVWGGLEKTRGTASPPSPRPLRRPPKGGAGERSVANLVAAGAVSGAVFGVPKGLGPTAHGAALGGGFSLAFGMLLQSLWWVQDAIADAKPPGGAGATADESLRDEADPIGEMLQG